jgi:endo-1,4-beta-xylanase
MGEAYIADMLRVAHQANPQAKLFINEYGLLEPGERLDAMLALVKRLQVQGVPLHGIGLQMHVFERGDKIKLADARYAIQQFAALGLETRISEADVYSDDGAQVQAEQYATGLRACLAESACKSFTIWIPTDKYNMWQDDQRHLRHGRDAPWDADVRPTPVITALKKVLRE